MFKWSAFPFIRVSICMILGILSSVYFPELWENHLTVLISLLGVFLVSWLFLKNHILYGLVSLVFISYLGGMLTIFKNDRLQPNHYTNFESQGFVATVISDATEKTNYHLYKVAIHQVLTDSMTSRVSGKLYLYVKKGDEQYNLSYGDVLVVGKGYFPISPPKNPHEFDFRKYLERQNVFAHAFVTPAELRIIDHEPPNQLLKWAYGIRRHAEKQLEKYITQDRERAILSALLLGIKDQLDNDIKTAYASAGAMHVLAVSGLHVGIVYYMLLLLFKPLKERRFGKLLFVAVTLCTIWMYALVTGFSPSVMRAATMFSVVIISDACNRRANIYNSLGISAFLLILYDPFMIYSVGFQLSFAAVFGIVILHPWLYRQYEARTLAGDYFWSITCVSIAAQLVTFPLSLYYFHQFPTYFLISNLLVIPAALLILSGGILMLTLGALVTPVASAIGFVLQWAVWGVNEVVDALKYLPYPLFDWLYVDQVEVVLIYAFLVMLVYGIGRQSFTGMAGASIAIIFFFAWGAWMDFNRYHQQKIIFYEVDDKIAIDLVDGNRALLLLDSSGDPADVLNYQINPNRIACGLPKAEDSWEDMHTASQVEHLGFCDLLYWQDRKIVIIKEPSKTQLRQPIQADVIYLHKLPDIPLDQLQSEMLLLGAKLRYYETEQLKAAADELGIKTHSLAQDGYWELVINCKNAVY